LAGLARRHGVTPLNLVVDNDTVKATALRVPGRLGSESDIRTVSIPFDRREGEVPYEERPVHDEALFAGLPGRAPAGLRGRGFGSMLPGFWAEVLRQAGRTAVLGERFAAARRAFERRWGCANLEVPVSLLCRTEPFAWFASHLLTHLPRFHATYNDCVH